MFAPDRIAASISIDAAVTVQQLGGAGTPGSVLCGYFAVDGAYGITKAGDNDCSVLVAVNNNTYAGKTLDMSLYLCITEREIRSMKL